MKIERIFFPPEGDEQCIRRAVVEEAKTWAGTPYMHFQSMKKVGVDCGHLGMAAYRAAGFDFRDLKIDYIPPQWFQTEKPEEVLLNAALLFTVEVTGPPERLPKPADLVLFRLKSKVFNHVGIVMDWPTVVHARPRSHWAGPQGFVEIGKVGEDLLRCRHIKILSPF